MEKKNVISRKNLPTKFPLFQSIVVYIALDYYNAEGWVWGVIITIFSLFWISCIIGFCKELDIDIFKNSLSNSAETKGKSKFQQRLDDYLQKQKDTSF